MLRKIDDRSLAEGRQGFSMPPEVGKHIEYYRADPGRIDARLFELEEEWSADRVVSANAAALSLAGLCLGAAGRKRWFFLPAAALAFLADRVLRGRRSGSLPVLRRVGYRTEVEIEEERQALRALRGDFRDAQHGPVSAFMAFTGVPPSRPDGDGSSPEPSALPRIIAQGSLPGAKPLRSWRVKGPRKPWYRRWLFWIPMAIVVLVIAFRIALTPIVTALARDALQRMPGFTGRFDELSLRVLSTTLTIDGLSLDRVPPADPATPFITMKKVHLTIFWKELLKGRMVASAKILAPHFHVVIPPPPEEAEEEDKTLPPPPPEVPDLAKTLGDMVPVLIDRVEIQDGEMVIVDAGAEGRPEIRVGDIEVTVENIETGTQLGSGRPSVFSARARVEKSGELAMFYTADLLAKSLTFAGQAKLEGLKLGEINEFLAAKAGLTVEKGTFDVYTAFSAKDGKFIGGVKPLLKGLDIDAVGSDIIAALKEGLIDSAVSLLSDSVPDREAVAALIPIRGEIMSPSPQIVPTVLSIIRNAFVEGLASGFQNLPPPASNRSLFSRVTGLFSEDEGPPQAESEGGGPR